MLWLLLVIYYFLVRSKHTVTDSHNGDNEDCNKCAVNKFIFTQWAKKVFVSAGSHCYSSDERPAWTTHLSQSMDYAHPVIWCTTRSKCIVIYVWCHMYYVWHKVTKCGFRPSGMSEHRLAARGRWSSSSSQRTPSTYHRGYSRNICQSPTSLMPKLL